jgi:hypothetical protein
MIKVMTQSNCKHMAFMGLSIPQNGFVATD